jgi:hypothetical protein
MQLQTVQSGLRLAYPAAPAWLAMEAACQRVTGVDLRISYPYGAYRTIEQQWEMWRDRSTSTTGQVAYPGTSVHGTGLSVDIANWGLAADWLRRNARTYGFTRTIWDELWHFEHNGITVPSGGGQSSAITEQEETMRTSQGHYTDGGIVRRIAFTPGTPWYLEWSEGGSTIANALAQSQDTGNSIPITKSMRDAIVTAAERVAAGGS